MICSFIKDNLNNYKYEYNCFLMEEKNYEKFRVHEPSYSEPSALMNVKKEGNGFTVEMPDKVTSEEIYFKGQTIAYQRFRNLNRANDIFIVGGIRLDGEYLIKDDKKYIKVKPILNKKNRREISDLLTSKKNTVEFL